MIENIKKILELSEKRIDYLHNIDNRGWYEGYKTYIEGIKNEFSEMEDEIKENNSVYLEDELGDVFWNYICLLNSMEQDKLIDIKKVFERCNKKFSERINSDGKGGKDWDGIKKKQKEELLEEHNIKYNKQIGK